MKKYILTCIAFLFLLPSCKVDKSTISPHENIHHSWTHLGLSDKYVLKLRIYRPYLYACTGPGGLWRKNVATHNSGWEYLGMSNDSLDWDSGLSLTDVAANANNLNEIMIIYHTSSPTDHHVYKTMDGGKSWFVSDSGLSYESSSPPPYEEEIYYANPTIFCHTPHALYVIGGKVCYTEDFGKSWSIISDAPYVRDFRFNEDFENVLIGGGSGFFEEPFLFYSRDYGNTWEYFIIDTLNTGGPVTSLALDRINSELLYVSMWTVILRSYDFGVSWQELYASTEGVVRCLEEDISQSGRLFASDASQLLETVNFGKDWVQLESPNIEEIRTIVYDSEEKALYIGTEAGAALFSGVFVYR